jgi:cytochrome c-type biogenesis protein CcmE
VKRYDKLVLLLLLVVFGVGGYRSISSALTPYVTFAYAEESSRSVQVKGYGIDGTVQIIDEDSFSFEMEDMDGKVVRVFHKGPIPQNLMEADNIVVVGKYADGGFTAQRILVKCPSKYEAQ